MVMGALRDNLFLTRLAEHRYFHPRKLFWLICHFETVNWTAGSILLMVNRTLLISYSIALPKFLLVFILLCLCWPQACKNRHPFSACKNVCKSLFSRYVSETRHVRKVQRSNAIFHQTMEFEIRLVFLMLSQALIITNTWAINDAQNIIGRNIINGIICVSMTWPWVKK